MDCLCSYCYVLVVFSFFEKTTYCCRARRLSVCPSVCPSVRLSVRLSLRLSVCRLWKYFFCGNPLSSKPIDLKIGLNVREGVVHVRKLQICKFLQINLCARFDRSTNLILLKIDIQLRYPMMHF